MKPSHVELPKKGELPPKQKQTRFRIVKLEERIAPSKGTTHYHSRHRYI